MTAIEPVSGPHTKVIPRFPTRRGPHPMLIFILFLTMMSIMGHGWASERYTCPMHPHYIADRMGTCPICGMDLVPVEDDSGMESDHGIHDGEPDVDARAVIAISPETIQNIGVRTENATMTRFGADVRSYGLVKENARNTHVISGRVAGWIEELNITAVGDEVKKGDLLFTLYSPDLISAQQDYIAAMASGKKQRIYSSTKRLQSLGVGPKALKQIEVKRRKLEHLPFYAETDGVVSHLMANRGSYITPGMRIAIIQDYSSVWIDASVAEKDLRFLEKNSKATVTFPNLGSMERSARIDYIHPTINPDSRTGRARLVLDNTEGSLKPGAYADVVFETKIDKRLGIPSEAILKSSDGDFVVVALGEGRFQSRKIETGIQNKGRTEIAHGLEKGETVVVSGQFLIDSESSLRESFRKLQKTQTPLALLKLSPDQQTMIDHSIDAALYLHESITSGDELEAEMLMPALQSNDRLLSKFRGTKLQFILRDANKALILAKEAITAREQRQALAQLVLALKPWITEGRPKYYKEGGIKLHLDHGAGDYWLQLEGDIAHPYGNGHAVEVELPDKVDAKASTAIVAPTGGAHAEHQ
uniref:Membrane fusion protein, Cu(I)/Ag(I) efflux system n=1 Tax=Candidatus Kentrum sp. TC TaxID=2126339 RepID=A0A450Z4Q0_9GAMM|nr:MAG: membrane fusion protein, Cu(I)/Ag(I) efflux system [Candidatus Kentron sp. TC]